MSFLGKLQSVITKDAPYWIANGAGGVFLQACGLLFDNAQATLLHGLRQTRPGTAFADALPFLGADRGIRRYPTEPIESYRKRLRQWRQIKRHAGSHYGEMLSLQPYFLPGNVPTIRVFHQNGNGTVSTCHTLNPDGSYSYVQRRPSAWNWDTSPGLWSRFWVVIYVNGIGPDAAKYNDGTVFDNGVTVYDGHLTSAQIADVVAIINESKALHATLWGVILATDPASFNPAASSVTFPDATTSLPVGNWGLATDPVTGLPTRLGSAIFAFDMGVP